MGSGSKFHGGLPTQGGTGGTGIDGAATGSGNGSSNGQNPQMSPKGQELLSRATTPETKDLVKQLYRPGATVGDGGTADALRREKATGQNTGEQSPLDLNSPVQGTQTLFVQGIAFDEILFEYRVRPAAEGDAALGIDAVADRQDHI